MPYDKYIFCQYDSGVAGMTGLIMQRTYTSNEETMLFKSAYVLHVSHISDLWCTFCWIACPDQKYDVHSMFCFCKLIYINVLSS